MKKQKVLQYLRENMASGEELEYAQALSQGYSRLHPGNELVWLSLPRDDAAARRETLEQALPLLMKVAEKDENPFAFSTKIKKKLCDFF